VPALSEAKLVDLRWVERAANGVQSYLAVSLTVITPGPSWSKGQSFAATRN
jgi:hypothetical protein